MCASQSLTHSDMLDSDRHSLAMKIEVRDDGTVGPSRLGYYKHHVPSSPHLHPHMTHTHSLCTGARQWCTYVFLVTL